MRISRDLDVSNLKNSQSMKDSCLQLNPEYLRSDPTGTKNFARQTITLSRSNIQSAPTMLNSQPEFPHHKQKKYPEVFEY